MSKAEASKYFHRRYKEKPIKELINKDINHLLDIMADFSNQEKKVLLDEVKEYGRQHEELTNDIERLEAKNKELIESFAKYLANDYKYDLADEDDFMNAVKEFKHLKK